MAETGDKSLFRWFLVGIFGMLMMICVVMVISIYHSNDSVTIRVITLFSTMFSGVMGLGAGYFLGRTASN